MVRPDMDDAVKLVSTFSKSGLLAAMLCLAPGFASAQDVERGRHVFKLCEACHSMVPGEHRYGPSLAGVVGRPAGRLSGYTFSDELAAARFRWDAMHLTQWLADEPKNMVAGTRMEFPGIPDPQDVRALIRYMESVPDR